MRDVRMNRIEDARALGVDVRKIGADIDIARAAQVGIGLGQIDRRAAIGPLYIDTAVERTEVRRAHRLAVGIRGVETEDDEGAGLALVHADDARPRAEAVALTRQPVPNKI